MPSKLKILLILGCYLAAPVALAQTQSQSPDPDRALLQRMYELRMRYDRERAQKENEARANVRLVTQSAAGPRVDSPTVTGLRARTNAQLVRFEQQFRCLDVDVNNEGGNTVVICGDNSGDVSGSNVSAGQDIVTIPGGTP